MRLEEVWFRYGRRNEWALCGATAVVEPGRAAIVLGRNGAGKSTLLQLAAGVLRPTRGAVVARPAVVGWVPERFAAELPHTVRGYLSAMGAVRGLRGPELTRTVEYWAERLGLGPYLGVKLPALSKGTAQKVGLAQAVLRRPGLLVLDEPWEGLDAQTRDLVPELIAEVLAVGGAVLVSDHRGETARLPDAIHWVVTEGRLAAGPMAETVVAAAPAEAVAGPVVDVLAAAESAAGRAGMADPAEANHAAEVCVIEVAVPVADVERAVARLREQGHRILRVRQRAAEGR